MPLPLAHLAVPHNHTAHVGVGVRLAVRAHGLIQRQVHELAVIRGHWAMHGDARVRVEGRCVNGAQLRSSALQLRSGSAGYKPTQAPRRRRVKHAPRSTTHSQPDQHSAAHLCQAARTRRMPRRAGGLQAHAACTSAHWPCEPAHSWCRLHERTTAPSQRPGPCCAARACRACDLGEVTICAIGRLGLHERCGGTSSRWSRR